MFRFRQCDIPVCPLYIPIPVQFTVQLYTKPVYSTDVHNIAFSNILC